MTLKDIAPCKDVAAQIGISRQQVIARMKKKGVKLVAVGRTPCILKRDIEKVRA